MENRAKVLVVDDTPQVARRIVELLDELDTIEVIGPVPDGATAIETFERARPACVVLDLGLPDISGVTVLRAIRAVDADCAVIVLTNHDEPSIRAQCFEAGATQFLRKATEFSRVGDLVRGVVEGTTDTAVGNILTGHTPKGRLG